jgi:hypothetical protein
MPHLVRLLPTMSIAVVLTTAGCGGTAERQGTEPLAAEDSPIRACGLLTENEWTEVLGARQAEPSEENLRVMSATPSRFKSSCLFVGEGGTATVFIERPYQTRAGTSQALADTLRGYQQDPASQRDTRLYPELRGRTVEPYDRLGIPAVTITPQDADEQPSVLAVRQTGITTGVRVEAQSVEIASRIAEKALGRLP